VNGTPIDSFLALFGNDPDTLLYGGIGIGAALILLTFLIYLVSSGRQAKIKEESREDVAEQLGRKEEELKSLNSKMKELEQSNESLKVEILRVHEEVDDTPYRDEPREHVLRADDVHALAKETSTEAVTTFIEETIHNYGVDLREIGSDLLWNPPVLPETLGKYLESASKIATAELLSKLTDHAKRTLALYRYTRGLFKEARLAAISIKDTAITSDPFFTLFKAILDFRTGRIDEAGVALDRIKTKAPYLPGLFGTLSEFFKEKGDFREYVMAYETAIDMGDFPGERREELARLLYNMNLYEAAEWNLRLVRDSGDSKLKFFHARTAHLALRFTEVLKTTQDLLKEDFPLAQKSEILFLRAIALFHEKHWNEFFDLASRLTGRRQAESHEDDARELLRILLSDEKAGESPHFHLGVFDWRSGRLDVAIDGLEQAFRETPLDDRIIYLRGILLIEQGLRERGFRLVRDYLAKVPYHSASHWVFFELLGNEEVGQTALYRSAIFPGDEKPLFELARQAFSEEKLGEAIFFLRKLERRGIRTSVILESLALCLMKNGLSKEALRYYEELTLRSPDNADYFCQVGVLYSVLGKIQRAKDAFMEALTLNPRHAEAHYNLGEILGKEEARSA